MEARTERALAIVGSVADYYGLDRKAILGKDARAVVARARHIAVYLVRHHLGFSYPELGTLFHKDSSSVQNSFRRAAEEEALLTSADYIWSKFEVSGSRERQPLPAVGTTVKKDTGWPATSWTREYRGLVDDQLVLRREKAGAWEYIFEPRAEWDSGRLSVE